MAEAFTSAQYPAMSLEGEREGKPISSSDGGGGVVVVEARRQNERERRRARFGTALAAGEGRRLIKVGWLRGDAVA